MIDSTKRFTNRVDNYVKYRPNYPAEIVSLLETTCGLTPEAVIADIGSGPGFLTKLFLRNGNRVFGVEPNAEMRAAGERLLAAYPNFTSIDATAEATTLPDESVDFITAGQAFHWFDPERTKKEFRRILKPNGWVVVIWNGFDPDRSDAMKAFQMLFIKHSTDYHHAVRELDDADFEAFFSPRPVFKETLQNSQSFDFEALLGRVLSMSYAPREDAPNYSTMIEDLHELFDKYQRGGKFVLQYETPMYYGQLG